MTIDKFQEQTYMADNLVTCKLPDQANFLDNPGSFHYCIVEYASVNLDRMLQNIDSMTPKCSKLPLQICKLITMNYTQILGSKQYLEKTSSRNAFSYVNLQLYHFTEFSFLQKPWHELKIWLEKLTILIKVVIWRKYNFSCIYLHKSTTHYIAWTLWVKSYFKQQ